MKRNRYRLAVLATALPLAAQAADEAALQCALLQDNALRLACYDKIFNTLLPAAQPAEAASPAAKPQLDVVRSIQNSIEQKTPALVFENEGQFEPAPQLVEAAEAYTPLSSMYDLDANSAKGILTVREHNPMYLMPVWYNSSPNRRPHSQTRGITTAERFTDQKRMETKMQVSFKTKLLQDLFGTNADLWFGYTQVSHWQVYKGSMSSPFRNTDYEPEIFLTQPVKADLPGSGSLRMLGIGAAHQSNGRGARFPYRLLRR